MKNSILLFTFILLSGIVTNAQVPNPALVGYLHNWNDANAPYIQPDLIDSRYNIIDVAFAVPQFGTDYKMEFIPDQVTPATFISQIQTLQGQGKKVIISIGGATSPISLDIIAERDTFIVTMNNIIATYGFDGIDIDFEGNSITVNGGTIAVPGDAKIVNLIYAIKQIMSDFYAANGERLILTMAPETAFVQGGMSAYGGIFGAYLPVIDALRDSLEILHVQLYNSGSMFGIDGNIYSHGTADFIVAMTEAVIQGFNTAGGIFTGLPANKVVVGLPACPSAAGGGFTDTANVRAAIDYLKGNGLQPGTYTLSQASGYPNLRGMMTWSINWDAVNNCESSYQYAENYENIFGVSTSISDSHLSTPSFTIYPNLTEEFINVKITDSNKQNIIIQIYNSLGEMVLAPTVSKEQQVISIFDLASGIYLIKYQNSWAKFIKM